jgi:flagellar hook-length control protein FliK
LQPVAGSVVAHPDAWSKALGQQLLLQIQQSVYQVQLRLDPPGLGVLEVQIALSQDQANIHFMSPHAPVREALESALPRLRQMFLDAGLTLADTAVSAGFAGGAQAHDRREHEPHAYPSPRFQPASPQLSDVPPSASVRSRTPGLIDDYA